MLFVSSKDLKPTVVINRCICTVSQGCIEGLRSVNLEIRVFCGHTKFYTHDGCRLVDHIYGSLFPHLSIKWLNQIRIYLSSNTKHFSITHSLQDKRKTKYCLYREISVQTKARNQLHIHQFLKVQLTNFLISLTEHVKGICRNSRRNLYLLGLIDFKLDFLNSLSSKLFCYLQGTRVGD